MSRIDPDLPFGGKADPGALIPPSPGLRVTLYVSPDDTTVDARWRGIGVRIEDDVLVTASGSDVLTQAIPKTVSDVEAGKVDPYLALYGKD